MHGVSVRDEWMMKGGGLKAEREGKEVSTPTFRLGSVQHQYVAPSQFPSRK